MTAPILLLGLLAIAAAAALIIFPLQRRAAIRRAIAQSFGKVPAVGQGLFNSETYWKSYEDKLAPPSAVDDLTWHDLDMDEVFRRVNGCGSTVGDVVLYRALRSPDTLPEPDESREALVHQLAGDDALLREVQWCLHRLGRVDGSGVELMHLHPELAALPHRWAFALLAVLPLVCVGLLFVSLPLGITLLLGSLAVNVALVLLLREKYGGGFRAVRYLSGTLAGAKRLARLLEKADPQRAAALREATRPFASLEFDAGILQFNQTFTEGLGIVCPLSPFMIPMLCYGHAAARLAKMGPAVGRLLDSVGAVDLALGLLSWRLSLPVWCRPRLHRETRLHFDDLRHPLLDEAVPSSADFSGDMLVTGSNASGKSTFLKAVALNILLAQSLGTCTASAFRLKAGRVATSMAVADSVVEGDSYFVAEIKSMRRLLVLVQREFHYFFIDEILKGTNTVERVAAAAAVVQYLHGRDCLCFAATHDGELTAILGAMCGNVHFREVVNDEGVHFDYQLQPGPATSRNAIRLLESMGFPPAIPQAARQLAQGFEETGQWPAL